MNFGFTAEQLRSAPTEVRQWVLRQIEQELLAVAAGGGPAGPPAHAAELAACTPEEAMRLFDLLRGDWATMQVFLELARDTAVPSNGRPVRALNISEIRRHTRLDDGRLAEALQAISVAFRQVRNDPEATLLGFDHSNHVYVHEVTHRSARLLWEALMRAPAAPASAMPDVPIESGFLPPRVGPSEDIAAHQRS